VCVCVCVRVFARERENERERERECECVGVYMCVRICRPSRARGDEKETEKGRRGVRVQSNTYR